MKWNGSLWLCFLICFVAVGAKAQHENRAGKEPFPIVVHNAKAKLTPLKSGAVYMTLENRSGVNVHLLGAQTPVAEHAVLYNSKEDIHSILQRIKLDSVTIPAFGRAILSYGGCHVMLAGVKDNALKEIPLSLSFDRDLPPLDVVAPVVPLEKMPAGSIIKYKDCQY